MVANICSRVVSSVAKCAKYGKRGVKVFAPTVFGTGQEAMAKAYSTAFTGVSKNPFKGEFWKTLWKGTKAAGRAAEANAALVKAEGGFWKAGWKTLKNTPKDFATNWKAASGLYGKTCSIFKTIGARMPLIGSVLLLGSELPNIIKATWNEGIVQGLAETGKAGAKLAGFTMGGVIGQTLIPIPLVGFIVGAFAGDWLTSKIVGKSYSERQLETENKIAEQSQTQALSVLQQSGYVDSNGNILPPGGSTVSNPFNNGSSVNPQQLQMYQQMLNGNWNNDFMAQAYFNNPTNIQSQTTQPQLNIKA